MTLMKFRCFVSVSASSGVPLIGSFRASSPGFRASSCKISSRRVVSYDQRSLSTRLSRSDLLSLQPHPCAMQYPGPYGESGSRNLGPASDLSDLEPPTSNVRVEATAKIIEVPAAPANFFMLIEASLFSWSFPYLPIPV